MYSFAVEKTAEEDEDDEDDEDDVRTACSLCGKKDTWCVACDVCQRDFCSTCRCYCVWSEIERKGESMCWILT